MDQMKAGGSSSVVTLSASHARCAEDPPPGVRRTPTRPREERYGANAYVAVRGVLEVSKGGHMHAPMGRLRMAEMGPVLAGELGDHPAGRRLPGVSDVVP